MPKGVQAAAVSPWIQVLMVSGFTACLGEQFTGKRSQRRMVMRKVVTCRPTREFYELDWLFQTKFLS
jgi:hypothetical protein